MFGKKAILEELRKIHEDNKTLHEDSKKLREDVNTIKTNDIHHLTKDTKKINKKLTRYFWWFIGTMVSFFVVLIGVLLTLLLTFHMR